MVVMSINLATARMLRFCVLDCVRSVSSLTRRTPVSNCWVGGLTTFSPRTRRSQQIHSWLYPWHFERKEYVDTLLRQQPHLKTFVATGNCIYLPLRYRYKESKGKGRGQIEEEDDEVDEDEAEEQEEDESSLSQITFKEDDDFPVNYKELKVHLKSPRLDAIVGAGLGMSRNKVDDVFYESRLKLNGDRVLKKSKQMKAGDYVDLVVSNEDGAAKVKRVRVVKISDERTGGDKLKIYLRAWRSANSTVLSKR